VRRRVRVGEGIEIADVVQDRLYTCALESIVLLEETERDVVAADGTFARLSAFGYARVRTGLAGLDTYGGKRRTSFGTRC